MTKLDFLNGHGNRPRRRWLFAIALVAAAATVAWVVWDSGSRELQGIAQAAVPSGARELACDRSDNWLGLGSFLAAADCTYQVTGSVESVAAGIQGRLEHQGYRPHSSAPGEVTVDEGGLLISAQISANAADLSVPRSNAHSQPGMVFVEIYVGRSDIPARGGAS
jgi:hypothetical protein